MNPVEPAAALDATYWLLLCRFPPGEAERLVALKRRAERGDFRELTEADRLAFAQWLVTRARLTDWPTDDRADPPRPPAPGRRTDPTGTSAWPGWWRRLLAPDAPSIDG